MEASVVYLNNRFVFNVDSRPDHASSYISEDTDSNQNINSILLEKSKIFSDSEVKKKESISREKNIKLEEPFLSAAWSCNPTNENWQVKLLIHNSRPDDLEERIGFIGVSTLETEKEGVNVSKVVKVNSTHLPDELDNRTFQKLLKRGALFTKLELCGSFFSNAIICPSTCFSPESTVHLIELPNLRQLTLKQRFNIPLKGTDSSTRDKYYQIHESFFNDTKNRAAKNIWYVIKSFNCPKLQKLEIKDGADWEQPETEEESYIIQDEKFIYWDQPLIEFINRHASTLKAINVTPVPVSQIFGEPYIPKSLVPVLEELCFCPELSLNFRDPKPVEDFTLPRKMGQPDPAWIKSCETWLKKGVTSQLKSWREILKSQKKLKHIEWICNSRNPFRFTMLDFSSLCKDNHHTETLMVVLHGDAGFRKKLEMEDQHLLLHLEDFQIDTNRIHNMTILKILSIACSFNDPQMRYFCLFNLHLLPISLETLKLSGIRVPASELEQLCRLTNLKMLTIFQENTLPYSDQDVIQGNIEGVTETVLKMLLNMRSLNQLVIMGFPFPIHIKDSEDTVWKETAGLCSLIGYMCGLTSSSNQNEEEESGTTNNNKRKSRIERYSKPLQDLLIYLMEAGEVKDIQLGSKKGDKETLLSIGGGEFPLDNYIK